MLSNIKRGRECRALQADATSSTMRLAAEEAAAEPASLKDVQRAESRRSSAEIYLLPGPNASSRLN
jgi:hypothetical protein